MWVKTEKGGRRVGSAIIIVLTEDLGSHPSIHIGQLAASCKGIWLPLLASMGTACNCTCTYTEAHT